MSKSPALRRIQADIRELALDPSDRYHASPLEHDMFEWHFTIRGADGTDFEGGIYHGRILLPPEYPFQPPHIMFLTPSGRFETNTKICLSFSAFHPELWQPAWGIRLILEALISFLPTPADGAIGALDWTSAERKRLAKESVKFSCPTCGKVADLLPKLPEGKEERSQQNRFEKQIQQLHQWQSKEHGEKEEQNGKEDSKGPKDDNEQDENNPANDVQAEQGECNNDPTMSQKPDSEQKLTTDEPDKVLEVPSDGDPSPCTEMETSSNVESRHEEAFSWFDPLLQGIAVLMVLICYLLVRKFMNLLEELQALET